MYRIMIADDEGIVIDSIKFIIEKEFGKTCETAHAKTGRSVIELAEEFRPDIAIMDIQMPGINGIDAMKEIRTKNKDILFIVMSAFDKFDYAAEAIKLGVLDYITKPMDKKKMIQTLSRAMEVIDKEKSKRSNELKVKERLETVIPMIESGLIHNLLLKEPFAEDIENYKTIIGIKELYGYMMVINGGDRQDGNHMTNAIGSGVRMQNHYQELREYLKDYFQGIVGSVMSNNVAVLVPCSTTVMDYDERNALVDHARELTRKLQSKVNLHLRIGIGGIKEFNQTAESYQEAVSALNTSNSRVAHAEDLPIRCDYEEDYPITIEKQLFTGVEKGEVQTALFEAKNFFDWMAKNYPDSIMDIRLKVLEFVLWAEHLAYEKGGMTYQFKVRSDYLPSLLQFETLSELKEWFLKKIGDAAQNSKGKRNEKSNELIETAKQYIQSHYMKDISLNQISRHLNISSYYFSKLFKDTTNENFIEYLNRVRIEKAKQLLINTNQSMKAICSMVGYSDPNYFSRSFKKYAGVTPTGYKEDSR